MTDKELLELAAKAAGISLDFSIRGDHPPYYINERGGHSSWNPLTDDGDALRLAVNLRFELDFGIKRVAVRTPQGDKVLLTGTDTLAATRRAITRAAAEIGKSMKDNPALRTLSRLSDEMGEEL